MPANIRPMYINDTEVDSPIKSQEMIFGIVVTNKVPLRPMLSISINGTNEPIPTPTYMRFTIQAISSVVTFRGSSSLNFGIVDVLHPSCKPQSMIKILPGERLYVRFFQGRIRENISECRSNLISYLIYLHTNPINICRNIPRSIVFDNILLDFTLIVVLIGFFK